MAQPFFPQAQQADSDDEGPPVLVLEHRRGGIIEEGAKEMQAPQHVVGQRAPVQQAH